MLISNGIQGESCVNSGFVTGENAGYKMCNDGVIPLAKHGVLVKNGKSSLYNRSIVF